MVHRGLAGVEVDRVAHRALVRQVDVDGVTEVHPQRRPWHLAAERPGLDDEAVGDGDVLVDDREVDVMDGALEELGRRGIEEGVLGRVRIGDGRRRSPGGDRSRRRGRSRSRDHDLALHPGIGVAGDRAQEGKSSGRDRDSAGRARSALGADLRAVGKGDVMEGRAGVLELDLVRAGRRHRGHRWRETEVERLDRDLLGICRATTGLPPRRAAQLRWRAAWRRCVQPPVRGPGRASACGHGKGEAGEYRKTGKVAAHLGSPDPFTAISSKHIPCRYEFANAGDSVPSAEWPYFGARLRA